MGEIYSANDLKKEAYAAYDSCLQYDPGNIGTLNNYAYFLSVDGVDLDRAEKMSAKVIAAEPKNATYLDTYAWILYRLGRYADAKIYIDQTLKFVSDSTSRTRSTSTRPTSMPPWAITAQPPRSVRRP